jgi:hypothetical protein
MVPSEVERYSEIVTSRILIHNESPEPQCMREEPCHRNPFPAKGFSVLTNTFQAPEGH